MTSCTSGRSPDAPASPRPTTAGPLRADASTIRTADGRSIRLLGVNLQGLQMSNVDGSDVPDACHHAWRVPPPGAAATIRSWGFNAVRLPIAWANLEPDPPTAGPDGSLVHHWNVRYLEAVDDVVRSLGREGLAVILDPAQNGWSAAFPQPAFGRPAASRGCGGWGMPSWLNPNAATETVDQARCDFVADRPEPGVGQKPWDGLAAVWTILGRRYADDPAVIGADTINEPYFVPPTCEGMDFPGMFRTLGTAIRDVAPSWLLLFEYSPERNAAFGLTASPPFANAVYEIHVYGTGWDDVKSTFIAAVRQSRQWRMPLFLGEFSAFGATTPEGGGPDWRRDTAALLEFGRASNMSWTVFGYLGGLSLFSEVGAPKHDVIDVLQGGF